MSSLPDFTIGNTGRISNAFINKGIHTFHDAIAFIQALPYKRNSNKNDLATVISDACGTCGTKHAILKALADENGVQGIDLAMGIYRMHDNNTRGVGNTYNNMAYPMCLKLIITLYIMVSDMISLHPTQNLPTYLQSCWKKQSLPLIK